jgi:hypothetical protein
MLPGPMQLINLIRLRHRIKSLRHLQIPKRMQFLLAFNFHETMIRIIRRMIRSSMSPLRQTHSFMTRSAKIYQFMQH